MPATRPGAVPAPRQAAGPPARRPASQPSWGVVLVTTFRLWVHRRMEKTGWRVLATILAAVILFAAPAGAVSVRVSIVRRPSRHPAMQMKIATTIAADESADG